jgi:indole-3-glycerol phosphate synthase
VRARPPSSRKSRRLRPAKACSAADFDAARIASAYQRGGASALSVLTDETFFQGSLGDLEAPARPSRFPCCARISRLPPRRLEAAAHGADAILLIAAILTEREIRDFREAAARYRMAALVEVHNRRELDVAIAAGSDIIGVNNRDLTTFEVALETSLRLAEHIPAASSASAKAASTTRAISPRLRAAGYTAFLVGEHLMKSGDPAAALRKLVAA